jgi:hypothetical protein
MKTYDVYKHPVVGYEAVKQGFSWPAFFFNWIWAFVKKMWVFGLLIIGISVCSSIIQSALTLEDSAGAMLILLAAQIGFLIFIGKKGNEWRRYSLKKRGFEHLKTVLAESPDGAIAIISRPAGTTEGT